MRTQWYVHGDKSRFVSEKKEQVRAFSTSAEALLSIEEADSEAVILSSANIFSQLNFREPAGTEKYDLIHSGLNLGALESLQSPIFVSNDWFFLDPVSDHCATSWKATPELCWLRPLIVQELGGFDRAYTTPIVSLMDFAFRLLRHGGRVQNDPSWIGSLRYHQKWKELPLEDEVIFIVRHFGWRAAYYASFWLSLHRSLFQVLKSLRIALARTKKYQAPQAQLKSNASLRLIGKEFEIGIKTISAIIPTLNRYEYLSEAITSLENQNYPLDEIIIVDQTPGEKRQEEFYESFDENTKVIFLERTGQSLARNAGVESASSEWCFLFDDDSVIWDNAISEHVKAIERSGAMASTGISLAPWKNLSHVPKQIQHFHLARVLDTGNSLIKKSAITEVGGFDPAFDKGSGADTDLGIRLYRAGFEIIFNPKAIRTHYKAKMGGLRTHGAWWREKANIWSSYPPPTQTYTIQKHYPQSFWLSLYTKFYLRVLKRHNLIEGIWILFSFPWKMTWSLREARDLRTVIRKQEEGR